MRTGHYKRKDGRWESYVIYNDPDTREEKKKSFYGTAKYGADARRQREKFIEKLEAGDYSDIKKVTVEGWLNKFLRVYCAKLEQTTIDGYKNYIDNHITPAIGKIKLRDLKSLHIQKFYNHERSIPRVKTHKKDGKMVPILKDGKPIPLMKDGKQVIGFSEKTILQEHRILHRAFEKAVVDGLMAKNPCDGVDAPSPDEYEPTIYSEEQFITLLNKLDGHRMEAIILLAGMCGLRRGELMGLSWEDVDLVNGVLHIKNNRVPTSKGTITKKTKTKKSTRDFSIPSIIIPSLKRLRGIGKLLLKLDGTEYNPGSVSRAFKEFLEKNNLPHIRLHDLRHFNGTMMLKHGVSDREASARLGHSNLLQTKKYQHVLKDMDKGSADKLNNVLSRQNNRQLTVH
ncbi:tyrosine-type recombinase/integrase [Desulforamulus ruminis]|uniref:tyrosine-type recombinase/integrase n=1 Tax=Desulforamulus ruminis TaxID=1564 RepID=UPI0023574F3E|nr:site-specific integrase [Desulforamulus ruminis]